VLIPALARNEGPAIAFCGLAAIPPVILAGHVVTDRQRVRLLDYHPDLGSWAWPGTPDAPPKLTLSGAPDGSIAEDGDAVIRLSVSYKVLKEQTDFLNLDAPLQLDISVAQPTRNIVRSEEQTREYGAAFRGALDRVRTWMPRCRRIHLFYAGPMALAFHLGQQISENIHPPVLAWNFAREYSWAIDLAAAVRGEPSIVRPGTGATG
jgi:hypothetical protein